MNQQPHPNSDDVVELERVDSPRDDSPRDDPQQDDPQRDDPQRDDRQGHDGQLGEASGRQSRVAEFEVLDEDCDVVEECEVGDEGIVEEECEVGQLEEGSGKRRVRSPDPAMHWAYFWVSVAIIVLAVILRVPDQEHVVVPLINQPVPGVCTFKRMVGVGCPGCGLTRCLVTLAKGDLARAWEFNPVGIAVAVLLVAQLPYRLIQLGRIRRGLPEITIRRLSNWIVLGTAAALFAQWVVRLLLDRSL